MTLYDNENLLIEQFILGPLFTNCYLICEKNEKDGILIDPGDSSEEIKDFIEKNNISIKYIVNTHGHADHIKGNASFGFPVIIHELDRDYLTDSSKNLSYAEGCELAVPDSVETVVDGDEIKLENASLKVIHTPGHTPGGMSLLCGSLLFSGDTLFFEGVGRADLPGGDHNALIQGIKKKLFVLPDDVRVFPGHGPETTIGYEKKNNLFVT